MSDKMIYKKFYFENYKGIKDKLEFPVNVDSKKPYCIIGNNEGGKTTILKGMAFISRLCRDEFDCTDIINKKEIDKIHKKDLYFTGNVKVGAILEFNKNDIEDISEQLKIILLEQNTIDILNIFSFEDTEYKKKEVIITLNNNEVDKALHKDIFSIIKKYSQDILYYDDFMFSVPEVVRFTKKNQQINDPENIFNSKLNKDWQKIFDDILTGSSHMDSNDTKIRKFQDDIIDSNTKEDIKNGRIEGMGDYLTRLLNNWLKNNVNTDIKGVKIMKFKEQNGFIDYKIQVLSKKNAPYDMSDRSKGLQWTFCFNILTSIRKERHSNGFIFLLDEPASNLHISLQGKMLQEMNKMCNNKNFVIYSTHAPDLIDLKNMDNWWFVENKAKELEETNISISQTTTNNVVLMPIISAISYNTITDAERKNKEQNMKVFDKIKAMCKTGWDKIQKCYDSVKIFYDKLPEPVKQVATDYAKKKIGVN